jgi:mannose/cellobiose epimerase-like protein (N-acyl-D-glucosamine 2-epimerase family)
MISTKGEVMPINNSVRNTLLEIRERAVANLKDSVLPFWARAWDHEQGGFFGHLDRVGNVIDPSEKLLIKQVRMLYSLSAAHRFGIAERGYLELAHRGFDYITGTMWDNEEGGFYYSVNREGRPSSTRKNTDVHGYVLIGLSEYYLASQRREALEWGNRVFDVLAEKAKDGERGYREEFDDGKWPVLNSEQMSLGDRNDIKTIDMHTNILEGLVYLCRASSDQKHRAALQAVLRLIVDKGLHPEQCGITAFDFDWNPVPDVDGRWTTSYGLNAELAWLLLAAVDVLHHPRESYRRAILGLIDHSLRFGFDQQRGGVAAFGPLRGHVLRAEEPACKTTFEIVVGAGRAAQCPGIRLRMDEGAGIPRRPGEAVRLDMGLSDRPRMRRLVPGRLLGLRKAADHGKGRGMEDRLPCEPGLDPDKPGDRPDRILRAITSEEDDPIM